MYYINEFVTKVLSRELVCHAITEDTTILVQKCYSFCSVLLPLATALICIIESIGSKTFPASAGEAPHCVSALHILMMTVVQIITLTCQHQYDNTVSYSNCCANFW